jgi:hypothetical protein
VPWKREVGVGARNGQTLILQRERCPTAARSKTRTSQVVSGQQAKPEKEHQAINWQAGSGLDGESGRVVIGETGKKGVDVGESLAAELLPVKPPSIPPVPISQSVAGLPRLAQRHPRPSQSAPLV